MGNQSEIQDRSESPESEVQPRWGVRIRPRTDGHNTMISQITTPRIGDEEELREGRTLKTTLPKGRT